MKVLTQADLTVNERGFFVQAEKNYTEAAHLSLLPQLIDHIAEIENTYHRDQKDKFVQLWPELNTKCIPARWPRVCNALSFCMFFSISAQLPP